MSLTVLDALGREVAVVARGEQQGPGSPAVTLDAGRLAAGVYVVRAQFGEQVGFQRLVVE